ncbi:hypothetical protein [Sphingobacterium rhinopitheci]|uniref:hypothetical protein n=1 Tax=Sphingobacterium rhinopitheci TaxID=2781960 RepID=UPI001F51CBB2|nr:hypothetical protein [Sphingobacterium rhinopitheci]MCI0922374.1 hypothetical protein [Sphingobacterium rhinopitheci]
MRTILAFVLTLSSFFSFAQQEQNANTTCDSTILRSFIAQLAEDSIAYDVILSQYMTIEKPNNDIYDYLEASLGEIRVNLMNKKLDEITYIAYSKMPKKDIKDIDIESLNPDNIYFLYYRNKQMLAVYLEEEKIASFTLVANGKGKAHFVLY